MYSGQLSLLGPLPSLPEGFAYRAELVSPEEEAEFMECFRELDFREYEFHGYFGKRRVVSFGLHYDTNESTVRNTEDIPGFLLKLRRKAADFAGLAPLELQQALVTEYTPEPRSAGIGTDPPTAISSASLSAHLADFASGARGAAAGNALR
jgi:hypothetical protein